VTVYGAARAYQVAFSYRDFAAEVDVLLRWFGEHARPAGTVPERVLELAAGPADHARELARRGIGAVALDLSPEMCAHAREQAARLPVEVVEADMTAFDLDRPVDLSALLLSSDCHLLDLDAFVGHLNSVARALRPGGLHILEMTHPADHFSTDGMTASQWEASDGGLTVRARWGAPGDQFDAVTQVAQRSVQLRVTDGSGAEQVIDDVLPERLWTATELAAAVQLSGAFDMVACYGSYAGVPLGHEKAWRMMPVLRRR
jgi:SAM-dependent methyltransferase